MKEIKVKYANGNELTWKAWEYCIDAGKLIYSSYNDNSINIIKLDNIISIVVDGEIVFDEFSEFRKAVLDRLSRLTDNRIIDVDVWKDVYYMASIIVISENHVVYRYGFHSREDDITTVKYDYVEVI